MRLSEITSTPFEITKLKIGLDEDVLAQMIEDHGLRLTFKGKPLDGNDGALHTLRQLVHKKIFDVRNPAYCSFDQEHSKVLYAPREKALYVRFAFLVMPGQRMKLVPSWHEYKLPTTLKGHELSLGTLTKVVKDPDTFNLTPFIWPPKK